MPRTPKITSIRIKLDLPVDVSEKSEIMYFQNTCLRPILKFQHPIILHYFIHYCSKQKIVWETLISSKRAEFIKRSILNDHKLKVYYFGLISALFTEAEFVYYLNNKTEINKRISTMLIDRLVDGLN